MNRGHTAALAVVGAVVVASSAAATPDATSRLIVFTRDQAVMTMNGDGTGQRRLPFAPYPRFSPDGRNIAGAVTVGNTYRNNLVLARRNGSARRTLVRSPACIGPLDWSPDGRRIAYTLDCEVDFMSVWVVDRDGRKRTRLTPTWNLDPKWSPNGRTILFTGYVKPRGWSLFLMDADGRRKREIRASYPRADSAFYNAQWSRDGRAIFFVPSSHHLDLYRVSPQGRALRNLTPRNLLNVSSFDLSRDGRKIVFAGRAAWNIGPDIYAMDADGTDVVQLTDDPKADTSPAWSPDGRSIVFTSMRDGNSEIYVMGADGQPERRLTFDRAYDDHARWAPGN